MHSRTRESRVVVEWVVAVSYVGVVLALDVARSRGWLAPGVRQALRQLHLVTNAAGFDWYKFVMWLVVPFLVTLLRTERVAYSLRATRCEWWLLGVITLGSCAAMSVVATTSELSAVYLGAASGDRNQRWSNASRQLLWTLSWLPGYEFMLRRVLLQRANALGLGSVALVAVLEFVYHLQKPLLEAFAVLFFSVGLSVWTRRRPASVLPLLAHLSVELVLIGFVATYGLWRSP